MEFCVVCLSLRDQIQDAEGLAGEIPDYVMAFASATAIKSLGRNSLYQLISKTREKGRHGGTVLDIVVE